MICAGWVGVVMGAGRRGRGRTGGKRPDVEVRAGEGDFGLDLVDSWVGLWYVWVTVVMVVRRCAKEGREEHGRGGGREGR